MATLHGSIIEKTITSTELEDTRELLIYLPPNYSPLYTYDLLIAQDGSDYFQLGRLARQADELISENLIKDLIIVGVPYRSVKERSELYHPSGRKHEAFIRFLTTELVPYLDDHYQTHQLASGRTLMGDSLAATVSLQAAFAYPNTFGQVILQSPYVNDHVLTSVKAFGQPHILKVYHVIGKEETVVKTTDGKTKDFLTPNRELSKVMKERGFDIFYDEFNGDHTWKYWQPDLRRALLQMFA
ncbi:alpha/beta hydrolase [Desertibacillus haloalkaliphilus]|uniref:alpha/beta hydrolase n=1 Tax=Desertibacillus haloalkaliphilus TaxID=1328930 RepID=UPI001C25E4D3|nr:alpha/beta hydrolase-fold protein [Desertibacillus haloalkaliphilus]MBU8906884.1 esterase family protein [Desertibacillus haloalkaliphilus]